MADQPYSHPDISPGQFEEHVGNFTSAVSQATPSERRAGRRWYPEAHREAVHMGIGMMPGVKVNHPSGNGRQSSPAGLAARAKWRQEHPDVDPVDLIRDKRQSEATYRASGQIAATSPASPSGMDWEKNSQAAWEAGRMKPEEYKGLQIGQKAVHEEQLARGAVKKAANRGQPTDELAQAAASAKDKSRQVSARVREPFKGTAASFAGNKALMGAYEIATERKLPEEVLSPLKTGHFQKSVNDPKGAGREGITVDEHMANILGGRTKWTVHRQDAPAATWDRSIPNINRPAGYDYAKDVIAEGANRLGMEPNQAQAIAWIHEKNQKNMRELGGVMSTQDKARATINRNVSNRLMEGGLP